MLPLASRIIEFSQFPVISSISDAAFLVIEDADLQSYSIIEVFKAYAVPLSIAYEDVPTTSDPLSPAPVPRLQNSYVKGVSGPIIAGVTNDNSNDAGTVGHYAVDPRLGASIMLTLGSKTLTFQNAYNVKAEYAVQSLNPYPKLGTPALGSISKTGLLDGAVIHKVTFTYTSMSGPQ